MNNFYKNMTDSGVVVKGPGNLKGIIVNSHTTGKIKLLEGLTSSASGLKAGAELEISGGDIVAAVHASGVLTSAGACVPAKHASTKITVNNVKKNDDFKIGNTTYKVVDTKPKNPYEILLGDDDAAFLLNVKAAINGGAGAGTVYGEGTPAQEEIIASTVTSTTLAIVARKPGTHVNSLATIGKAERIVFEDTTLGGGTGASVVGVTTEGALIKIGDITYTAVTALSETSGADAIPYQVLWQTNESTFLTNLKSAVNEASAAGEYSTGTKSHPQVVASTKTSTALTFVARVIGEEMNSVATSTTLANYSFGATKLAGGTNADKSTVTITGIWGDKTVYTFVTALSETSGAGAVPYEVYFGGSTSAALANLKKAIDKSATEGTHYGTGTIANKYVAGGDLTSSKLKVVALTAGDVSNKVGVSTTLEKGAWSSDTLTGGLNIPKTILNTITLPAEANLTTLNRYIRTGNLGFFEGLYFAKEGTVDVTFVWY